MTPSQTRNTMRCWRFLSSLSSSWWFSLLSSRIIRILIIMVWLGSSSTPATATSWSSSLSSPWVSSSSSWEHYSVPSFAMIVESTNRSWTNYWMHDTYNESLSSSSNTSNMDDIDPSELTVPYFMEQIMNGYLEQFLKKSLFEPPLAPMMSRLERFDLYVTSLYVGAYHPTSSLRNRRRQRQDDQNKALSTTTSVIPVLVMEFQGNASFYSDDAGSSSSSSSGKNDLTNNQTAMDEVDTMFNQFLELALSPLQLPLLRQQLIRLSQSIIISDNNNHGSSSSSSSSSWERTNHSSFLLILHDCTNITIRFDTSNHPDQLPLPWSTTLPTQDEPKNRKENDGSTQAVLISLIMIPAVLLVLSLLFISRRHYQRNHPDTTNTWDVMDHMFHYQGGGSRNGTVDESAAIVTSETAVASPQLWQVVQASDRYLSKYRPDLFRVLQQQHHTTTSDHSQQPFPPSTTAATTTDSTSRQRFPNILDGAFGLMRLTELGGNASFFSKRPSPPSTTPTSTQFTSSSTTTHHHHSSNIWNRHYTRKRTMSSTDRSTVIAATKSEDDQHLPFYDVPIDGDQANNNNNNTMQNTKTTMTGFTPAATWLRWASGGHWNYSNHSDGEVIHENMVHNNQNNSMIMKEDDDDYDEEEEPITRRRDDGIFRFDVSEDEEDNNNKDDSTRRFLIQPPTLACDEDPSNYSFMYRDFPRHDGTPCLIFEIGDDDEEDVNKASGDESDFFASWKLIRRGSSSNLFELAASAFSSSNNNIINNSTINQSSDHHALLSSSSSKKGMTSVSDVELVSDTDLHRMLEQHAKDHFSNSARFKMNEGDGEYEEEDFKHHLERLLASRFRQFEKRTIMERHREARLKERKAAAAAAAAENASRYRNDHEEADRVVVYDDDGDDLYDDEATTTDGEDRDTHHHHRQSRRRRSGPHRQASQHQLNMERDISALEETISPRSNMVFRKTMPPPSHTTNNSKPVANALTTTADPYTTNLSSKSTTTFQSTAYVPPPSLQQNYFPPPVPRHHVVSSHYNPPLPPPPPPIDHGKSSSPSNSSSVTSTINNRSGRSHTRKKSGNVEYALCFPNDTTTPGPRSSPSEESSSGKEGNLNKLRAAYRERKKKSPSMDELFVALPSNMNWGDNGNLREALVENQAPSMDELRNQVPLEDFLQRGRSALETSKRFVSSSSSAPVKKNPLLRACDPMVVASHPKPENKSECHSNRSTTPASRRKKKHHRRSLSDTHFHWAGGGGGGTPKRPSSTHSQHGSDHGDDVVQHKRTASFTDDVMLHGIYAQIRP